MFNQSHTVYITHITPLVINGLGGGHTDRQTHTHAYRHADQNNFKKPGARGLRPRAPGLKRQSHREHWETTRQDSVLESVTVSAAKLRELQENDTTLLKVCQSANSNVNPSVDNPFHWQDGLLY